MESLLFALVTCFPVIAADAKQPDPPPAKLELFAKEDWYKGQEGKEREFVGVLQKIERKGGVGFGRMNHYYFTMADSEKPNVRQVYVGSKPELLASYVGKKLKLVGKPVEFLKLEGRDYYEIWPARLEVLPPDKEKAKEKDADAGKELKIHARASWPYAKADPNDRQKPIQLVLRSAAELVAATPFRDRDALPQVVEKAATAEFAKLLKVDTIDWDKQMLVVVSTGTLGNGGIKIDVAKVVSEKEKVAVYWKTNNPKAVTDAFTHPSQMVLVDRAAGKADFRNEPAEKAGTLKEKVSQADVVAVGKIARTIEVGAGSFYYVTIELTEVLKGQTDKKTVAIRVGSVPGREPPAYTKKGAEGVWLFGKADRKVEGVEIRGLVTYLPLKELPAVKEVLPKAKSVLPDNR